MSMEVETIDGEIAAIIRSVGGNVASYKRDRSRALNRLVSEIYSPPRVAAAAKLLPSLGCLPGFSLDLTTCDENGHPWDFDVAAQRDKARKLVVEQKPLLLIGAPCARRSQPGRGSIT